MNAKNVENRILGLNGSVGNLIFPGVDIGDGHDIGDYCIIRERVRIGANCRIFPQVLIMPDTEIGDDVLIGDGASIRERCMIGNGTKIGSKVRIEDHTVIGNNVSIETQSHITGHMVVEDDVFVGAAVVTCNDHGMNWKRKGHGQGLKGPTLRRGCRIGSGAILLPGVTVGEYAIVNAGEVVRKDVPPRKMYFTIKGRNVYKSLPKDELE